VVSRFIFFLFLLKNRIYRWIVYFRKNIRIGKYTYGCPRIYTYDKTTILTIGKFCSISSHVVIFLGGEHRADWVTTFPFSLIWNECGDIREQSRSKGNVAIGNDVWIGYGAVILSGSTISDGAVIGAGAVVSGDIPPYAVVSGNPARVSRYRFDQETVEQLLRIRWWDWETDIIRRAAPFLLGEDLKGFFRFAREHSVPRATSAEEVSSARQMK
jgi:acetyltransferase-like isoleucine patch superfamily enzyme